MITIVQLGSAWEHSIIALTTALDGLGGPVTRKKQEIVVTEKTTTVTATRTVKTATAPANQPVIIL